MNWVENVLNHEISNFKGQIDGCIIKQREQFKIDWPTIDYNSIQPISDDDLNLFIIEFINNFNYSNLHFKLNLEPVIFGWEFKDFKYIIEQLKRVLGYGKDIYLGRLYKFEDRVILKMNTELSAREIYLEY